MISWETSSGSLLTRETRAALSATKSWRHPSSARRSETASATVATAFWVSSGEKTAPSGVAVPFLGAAIALRLGTSRPKTHTRRTSRPARGLSAVAAAYGSAPSTPRTVVPSRLRAQLAGRARARVASPATAEGESEGSGREGGESMTSSPMVRWRLGGVGGMASEPREGTGQAAARQHARRGGGVSRAESRAAFQRPVSPNGLSHW
jgi:hypothetical protein